MIDRFSVEGFKSLVKVDIELGQLNVFIGANGSGKSNLLEAVGLLGCAVGGRVGQEAFSSRGVRPGQPALFKTAFREGKIPRIIKLSGSCGGLTYQVGLENPTEKPAPFWRFQSESLLIADDRIASRSPAGMTLKDQAGRRIARAKPDATQGLGPLVRALWEDPALLDVLDAMEQYCIYTPFTPMLRSAVPDPSERPIVGLSGGRLAEALWDLHTVNRAALQEMVGELGEMTGWTTGLQINRRPPSGSGTAVNLRDKFMRAGRNDLPAGDVSEGSLYLLFLLILIHHPAIAPSIAIDNVDAALNPLLAREIIERLQAAVLDTEERQVLLTAHNPLVLDALELSDDRVRLFRVQRNNLGHSEVTRIQYSNALAKAQARGATLSQLWVEGALGGVPAL